jgi:GNAT superfamily N-acetyltransferase
VDDFRRAAPNDAATIRALTRAAYAKWIPVIGREPMPMAADYEVAVREHLIDLLISAGEVVGLVEMKPLADHLLIENVAVTPAMQGKGYGRALMARAEQIAVELGRFSIRLYTHHKYEENIRLYTSLGYAVDGREDIADGFKVHMSKRLPAR